jgi:hypothetical protein
VRTAGWGVLAAVSNITGLARSTIERGPKDLDTVPLPRGQVGREGGGPRPLTERDPTLLADLKHLVEPATLGDPIRPLLWCSSGGSTPFKGQKGSAWEGGYGVPMVVRWPGHIKPSALQAEMFASLDWLPTFVEIAGGPKGNDLKAQLEAGKYPGIVKTTLDGVNQREYLEGTSNRSTREVFFYYSGRSTALIRPICCSAGAIRGGGTRC